MAHLKITNTSLCCALFTILLSIRTCICDDNFEEIEENLDDFSDINVTNVTELISNNDFEIDMSGWGAAFGGTARLRLEGARRSEQSLEVVDRDFKGGPSYELNSSRMELSEEYILNTDIKILDENDGPFFVNKRAAKRRGFHFLIVRLTIVQTDGSTEEIDLKDEDPQSWKEGDWNTYRTVFRATEAMITAPTLILSFSGTKDGTKIIIDNVSLIHHIPPPVVCNKPLFYDDAENGIDYSWIASKGFLDLKSPGADNSTSSYYHSRRTRLWDGVYRFLQTECFIPDAPYEIFAQFKLIDQDGTPYACDKKAPLSSGNNCPIVNLNLFKNGRVDSKERFNEYNLFEPWKADEFNIFVASFKADEDLMAAERVTLSIAGVEKRSTLVFDNVRFYVGCETLYLNSFAEEGHTNFWLRHGGGDLLLTNRPYAGQKAFIHSGRRAFWIGPGQTIDLFCFREVGSHYIFTGRVMVLDENNERVTVDKWAKPRDKTYLRVALRVTDKNGKRRIVDIENDDRSEWDKDKHNVFRCLITVTPELKEAKDVFVYLRGPQRGYSIVFDNVFISSYRGSNCYKELLMSDDDQIKGIMGWRVSEPSYLNRIRGSDVIRGFRGRYFYEHTGRVGSNLELTHDLDPGCFYDGMKYVFESRFKLTDENNNLLPCSRDVQAAGDNLACPMVSFRFSFSSGETKEQTYRLSEEWNPDSWNEISFEFLASADFFTAESITLVINGPPKGVNVLIDGIDLQGLWPSVAPTEAPTKYPTKNPTRFPTITTSPSQSPTSYPSIYPSKSPTSWPTLKPSKSPTSLSTDNRSDFPTLPRSSLILNGDAAMGTTGWHVSNGGRLEVVGKMFKYSSRTSQISGPEQVIPTHMLKEGKQYEFSALVTLRDEDDKPFFCSKEAEWKSDIFCVVLSIKRRNQSKEKVVNFANDESSWWVDERLNIFRVVIKATHEMVSAEELTISFTGPKPGVSIIFTNVTAHEISETGSICNQLIFNGDMKRGTLGWKAINGGVLRVEQAPNSNDFVLRNYERITSYSGISQKLNPACISAGTRLELIVSARMYNESGDPMTCDKGVQATGHVNHCPAASLKIIHPTRLDIFPLENQKQEKWVANDFNIYHSIFTAPSFEDSDSVYLTISGVRKGASIVVNTIILREAVEASERSGSNSMDSIDEFFGVLQFHNSFDGEVNQVLIPTPTPTSQPTGGKRIDSSTDICSELITNIISTDENVDGWSTSGGKLAVGTHIMNGSDKSFESYGRSDSLFGPKHKLNMDCLKEGMQYVLTAYISLKDKSGESIKSNKHAKWGDKSFFTSTIYIRKPSGDEVIDLRNEDPSQWLAADCNYYRAVFKVTRMFAGATGVFLLFRGPEAGISIDFNGVSVAKYEQSRSDCKELISHGMSKDGKLFEWSVTDSGGYLDIVDENDEVSSFFKNGERTMSSSGVKYELDTKCLVKGKYEFNSKIKLEDEQGDSVSCAKKKIDGTISNCPIVSIEYVSGKEKKLHEIENIVPDKWDPELFNRYYSVVTISEEISSADKAYLRIDGPSAYVSILFDNVSLKQNRFESCNHLVANGGAEEGIVVPWESHSSGRIDIVSGGANDSSKAFKMSGRSSFRSGPKQKIDIECLIEGTEYEFHAKVKLEDEKGNPFFCHNEAKWESGLFCVVLTIGVAEQSGIKILNLPNESPEYWNEHDYNEFRAVFVATKELISGYDMFFVMRGPKAGVSIIFDEVSIAAMESFI